MANISTPVSNRFYLFNVFERVKPENVETFKEKWDVAAQYAKCLDGFEASYLHLSIDPDAKFPWINFAITNVADICIFGKPDPDWRKITREGVGPYAKGYPAGFREIASYKGNVITDQKKDPKTGALYFITVMKVSDNISDDDFETNWKKWSGADLLHEKLGNKAMDSHLYKRFTSNMAPVFRYAVRTEVDNVSNDVCNVISKAINERIGVPDGIETATACYDVAIAINKPL
ncbi:uncharacterized protein LOC143465731 [Clavelina lepadiformis]|uniref:uncharacterized protein LOC143465731 n=1 Tax=Clavelina lepadiformis TaxID=159417 RepID=UPI0040419145